MLTCALEALPTVLLTNAMLQAIAWGLSVRVALTETPENTAEIGDVATLLGAVGVAADSFAVRPLLRRGFSARDTSPGHQ